MRSACCHGLALRVVPLLLPFTVACMGEHDSSEMHLKKMQDDITRLQSETDRMGERLDAMEVRQASTPRGSDERVSSATGPTTTLSRPKLKIVRVEPGNELGMDGDPDQAADADNSPRVVIQGEGKSLETRTLPAPTAAKSAPAPATKSSKSDKSEGTKSQKSDPVPSK